MCDGDPDIGMSLKVEEIHFEKSASSVSIICESCSFTPTVLRHYLNHIFLHAYSYSTHGFLN